MRHDQKPAFVPIRRMDGYLPIEDYGLIGNGETATLVGRDGAIAWLCIPRFDSEPVFCGLLDALRGGHCTVALVGLAESRQYYEGHSGILTTEMRAPSGVVRLTDVMPFRRGADLREDSSSGREEILRYARVMEGEVDLEISISPRGGGEAERRGEGLLIRLKRFPNLAFHVSSTLPLNGLQSTFRLKRGDTVYLVLNWANRRHHHHPVTPEELLKQTRDTWRRWAAHFHYEGPQRELVLRSAITLKMLDHFRSGAMIAAPTSSLPEVIGGVRNWDYRFSWIRDAALSVYALFRIGFQNEAGGFLGWLMDAVERGGTRVLYDLDGNSPPPEQDDHTLEGYRKSRPVRWGNRAAEQVQNDIFGEILDCAYQWSRHHGSVDANLWSVLKGFVEAASKKWREPDRSIWEIRAPGRPFTYSAAMCQVALDRGARMVEAFQLPGDAPRWRRCAEEIRNAILEESWDHELESLTEHLGRGGLDASLLSLPVRRVISFDHPRMVATSRTIARELGAGNGLLYRYLPEKSPDGIAGREGAFLLCSFWLADNLAGQGRLEEAMDLYDSLCSRAGPLGLLPEQIDPGTGAFLGNYPQAFSHIGVIASGYLLGRKVRKHHI